MELLPQELLLDIFKYLRMKQKQECVLVCHYWASIIRSECLFDTVDLYAGNVGNGPLSRLMEKPTQCTQIKRLILQGVEREMYTESFFEYFRNLDLICLKNSHHEIEDETIINTQENVVQRHNQLTNIIELNGNYYSSYLLASELCSNLTSLTVHFEPTNEHNNTYFSNLSNAPNLSSLTLINLFITISRLETIHINLEKLEILDIREAYLQYEYDGALLANILPCTCIKTFFLNLCDGIVSSDLVIFNYIKKKYINMEHFGFLYDHYHVNLESYNDVSKLITQGLIPFLDHFGPQLKTFKTPFETESSNIITSLDQFNCKLESLNCLEVDEEFRLDAFDTFYTSNQSEYVKELVLTVIHVLDVNAPPLYKLVGVFTGLVALELEFQRWTPDRVIIYLDRLLDLCPDTLTTLSISSAIFYIDSISEKEYTLNKLKLWSTVLPNEFDIFLSNNCKKLRHLILDHTVPTGRFLHLPNLHLTCLNIHDYAWNSRNYILIKTLNDNKRCKYPIIYCDYDEDYLDELANRYGAHVYNTLPMVRYEGCEGEAKFGVTCGSIDHMIINTLVVF